MYIRRYGSQYGYLVSRSANTDTDTDLNFLRVCNEAEDDHIGRSTLEDFDIDDSDDAVVDPNYESEDFDDLQSDDYEGDFDAILHNNITKEDDDNKVAECYISKIIFLYTFMEKISFESITQPSQMTRTL
ncbi:hypothetical protein FQA39_LY04607 [Lamprigera yunnana]|nr:hypothetical protein FQA39_LY04607 [Lamprigera yunnana]